MKNYFSIILSTLAIISCQKIEKSAPEIPSEPDTPQPVISADSVMVSICSNIDISSSPLTKASSNDGLYALRVYQFFDDGYNQGPLIAAYGTFDDLGKAVIKLSKKSVYGFDLAYIPNAKTSVQHSGDYYGVPFDAVWAPNGAINELVYVGTSTTKVWPLTYGATQEKGISDNKVQENNWSTIQRYQGVAFCDPAVSSSVNITLYSMMIGFHLEISDFTEGEVCISGWYGHKYMVKPSNGSGVLDVVVQMENMPSCSIIRAEENVHNVDYDELAKYVVDNYSDFTMEYSGGAYGNTYDSVVNITYFDNAGNEVILYRNNYFGYKRNTRYTLKFSLSDAIRNGGISSTIADEGEMANEEFPF